jgi:hypothetical protein
MNFPKGTSSSKQLQEGDVTILYSGVYHNKTEGSLVYPSVAGNKINFLD